MSTEIRRVIVDGELRLSNEPDKQELLDACGRALDKHYAQDAIGDVIFEGTDGKFYAVFVEAVITEVEKSHAANFDSTLVE